LQERANVVEDLKLRFRQAQIEQEGNDPAVTGVSFGTPHDLATVHMSSDDVEEKDKGGRPPEGIKFGQHKNAFGWDPTGKKEIDQAFNAQNQMSAFKPNPDADRSIKTISNETVNMLKQFGVKRKNIQIITETLNHQQTIIDNRDTGTMLDENNIL